MEVWEYLCVGGNAAWRIARNHNGAAGVDGITFEGVEQNSKGVEGFLVDLHEFLKRQSYHPNHVKRVCIPKSNGGQRPLGISTIKDRVLYLYSL